MIQTSITHLTNDLNTVLLRSILSQNKTLVVSQNKKCNTQRFCFHFLYFPFSLWCMYGTIMGSKHVPNVAALQVLRHSYDAFTLFHYPVTANVNKHCGEQRRKSEIINLWLQHFESLGFFKATFCHTLFQQFLIAVGSFK